MDVRKGDQETFDEMLRRFTRKVQESGILAEARRREFYEAPSERRRRKLRKRNSSDRSAN
jgi:small subunit ribosomal protein S21